VSFLDSGKIADVDSSRVFAISQDLVEQQAIVSLFKLTGEG
jgi:hypothetical protein